jgi:type IV pilus assembly protein PilF
MIHRLVVVLAVLFILGCMTRVVDKDSTPKVNSKEAAQINLQLAMSYYRQGDMNSSRKKLEQSIAQNPSLAPAYRMLGLIYQSMGDFDEADKKYLKSVNLASSDPDTLNDYAGFLCFQRGDEDKALEYFDKAIRVTLNQNRSMLYSNAAICAMRNHPQQAENYLRSALAADSQNSKLIIQMADLAYRQKNYLQARMFLNRADELVDPSPTTLFLFARIEDQLGNISKSSKYRTELFRLYPLSEEAIEIDKDRVN